ncbi:hypothetical protein EJB05_49846, partial [Eragrostis curvula]
MLCGVKLQAACVDRHGPASYTAAPFAPGLHPRPPRQPPTLASTRPVVLLPGNTCSQLEARVTDTYGLPSLQCKGDGRWFYLWKHATAQRDPGPSPRRASPDQLRLVYDPAARDFRNVAVVETRVVGTRVPRRRPRQQVRHAVVQTSAWGRSWRRWSKPGTATARRCLAHRTSLPAGVRRAEAAVPVVPHNSAGVPEPSSSTSSKNGGKSVVLVSNRQDGYFALEFLNRNSLLWRTRRVRVPPLHAAARRESRRRAQLRQRPKVFGRDATLVELRRARHPDVPGCCRPLVVTLYEARALPVALNFRAPLVPATCVNGVGVPMTTERINCALGRRL